MHVPNVKNTEQTYETLNQMIYHASIYSLMNDYAYVMVLKMYFLQQQHQDHLRAY